MNSHATALQSLAKAASTDIQQTREVLADVSMHVDAIAHRQQAAAERLDAFTSRSFLQRFRWLVLGG